MENRISHERLLNLIIYVLMDQAVMSYELAEENSDGEMMAMHDAILNMRENVMYMCEIEDWVCSHIEYVDEPANSLDPHYYEMIVDAIGIIYYDDYNQESISGTDYAFDCEKKYSRYTNN